MDEIYRDMVAEAYQLGILILIPVGIAISVIIVYPILRAIWNWSLKWFD
jgi:hypothetical protein